MTLFNIILYTIFYLFILYWNYNIIILIHLFALLFILIFHNIKYKYYFIIFIILLFWGIFFNVNKCYKQ